jgi:hypothetical protein
MQDDPAGFFHQRAVVSFYRRRRHPANSEGWHRCVKEARQYICFYRETVTDMCSAERGEIDMAEVLRRVYARLEKHLGHELPPAPECWDPYPILPPFMPSEKKDAA